MGISCESFLEYSYEDIAEEGIFKDFKKRRMEKKWSGKYLSIPKNKWEAFKKATNDLEYLEIWSINNIEQGNIRVDIMEGGRNMVLNSKEIKIIFGPDNGEVIRIASFPVHNREYQTFNNVQIVWKRFFGKPQFTEALECLKEISVLQTTLCNEVLKYEESSATEGFIDSIKSRLKKICYSLYKKALGVYERNKTKHPRVAALFKKFADFFKRHAGNIDKAHTKEQIEKENSDIKNVAEEMKKTEEKLTPEQRQAKLDEDLKKEPDPNKRMGMISNEFDEIINDMEEMNEETEASLKKRRAELDELFKRSQKDASDAGVPENKILHKRSEIDEYFTGKPKSDEDINKSLLAKLKKAGASKEIKEAVSRDKKEGSHKNIAYIFADALDVDPTFIRYTIDFEYVKSQNGFAEHEELTPLKSEYTEKYWVQLRMDFVKNPSIKRLNHMKKIAKVFLKEKINRLMKERREN